MLWKRNIDDKHHKVLSNVVLCTNFIWTQNNFILSFIRENKHHTQGKCFKNEVFENYMLYLLKST